MRDKATLEKTIAPDVEPVWASQFIIACRVKGVPGDAIADALAEVNDYVHSRGGTAQAAFGPAADYAAALDLPRHDLSTGDALAVVVPAVVSVLGLVLVLSTVRALRDATLVDITLGQVISLAIIVAAILLIAVKGAVMLDAAFHRTWAFILAGGLVLWASIFSISLFRQVVATVPAWPVLIPGVVLVALGSYLYLRQPALAADPIEPPLSRSARRISPRRAGVLLAVFCPLVTLGSAILLWFVA